ncbi:MAG: alcohol dehydrogenase catalytic domain-containing protein [Firmicutes bacterium]|nr:alcohol dehydrogenase catalytic domain-containing protein [Bacillota bacterium]
MGTMGIAPAQQETLLPGREEVRAVAVKVGQRGSLQTVWRSLSGLQDHQVLVQTLQLGIDATDRAVYEGNYGRPAAPDGSLVVGHEAVGRVIAVGRQVHALVAGMYVVPTVRRPCADPSCSPCRAGEPDYCRSGAYTERGLWGADGYLAEYFVEDAAYLVPLPPPLKALGILTEPASVVIKAMHQIDLFARRMRAWHPQRALVLGAGQIGLLATCFLRRRGWEVSVFDAVSEIDPKASLVQAIGARFLSADIYAVEQLPAVMGSPDLVVEATGVAPLAVEAAKAVGEDGVVLLLGVADQHQRFDLEAGALEKQLVLGNRIVCGSVSSSRGDFEEAIGWLSTVEAEHPGWLGSFIAKRIPLEEVAQAYRHQKGEIKRAVWLAD